MKCPKCGQDWPSEFYFDSPGQCIYCDKKEGITRAKGAGGNRPVEAKSGKFPDLIQMFFILILIFNILATIGLVIEDLQSVSSDTSGIDLTIGLPINAIYENAVPVGNGIEVTGGDFKAVIHGHHAVLISFRRLPDLLSTFLLFFHAYKLRLVSVVIIILLMLFYQDVQRGKPFLRNNLNRLNVIAIIIVLIRPVEGLLGWWIAGTFVRHLHVPAATLKPVLDLGLGTVLWGMVMLADVQIVKRGIKLQEEHDLTI
ncbi:MAG TPA: DUF2975 domain-containing protein [Acidobacteriota bacterium]|nr:DUF2975 domain-containing protein [Acidobacteriota bacterium]